MILVDTSTSITRDDLAHASSIVTQIERHKGSNWVKVVPFAGQTRNLLPQEVSGGLHLVQTVG